MGGPLRPGRKRKRGPALKSGQGALECETRWERGRTVSTAIGAVSRVTARPATGRQHQLRVHFRSIEAPLVVDPLYGGASERAPDALGPGSPALSRLTLHATSLSFPHPTRTGERVQVRAPPTSDVAATDAWRAANASVRAYGLVRILRSGRWHSRERAVWETKMMRTENNE